MGQDGISYTRACGTVGGSADSAIRRRVRAALLALGSLAVLLLMPGTAAAVNGDATWDGATSEVNIAVTATDETLSDPPIAPDYIPDTGGGDALTYCAGCPADAMIIANAINFNVTGLRFGLELDHFSRLIRDTGELKVHLYGPSVPGRLDTQVYLDDYSSTPRVIVARSDGLDINGDGDTDVFLHVSDWSVTVGTGSGADVVDLRQLPPIGDALIAPMEPYWASPSVGTGGGDDVVYGSLRKDYVGAGAGNDRVWGNGGSDSISLGDGTDWAYGGSGHDDLIGGLGNDTLLGGSGRDAIYGDQGSGIPKRDRTRGGGNDVLVGGPGADDLWGNHGSDRISGGGGKDTIVDWHGRYTINAGRDRDYIWLYPRRLRSSDSVDCGRGIDKTDANYNRLRRCERYTFKVW